MHNNSIWLLNDNKDGQEEYDREDSCNNIDVNINFVTIVKNIV